MYAIVFDLDTQVLQELYHNAHYNNAYADIKKYLTTRGFEWKQGNTFFGNETIEPFAAYGPYRNYLPNFLGSNPQFVTFVCCGLRKITI
jgi:virulence-associated protein VapD